MTGMHYGQSDKNPDQGILKGVKPGQDARKAVYETTNLPYSTQGRIQMSFDGEIIYGSGTLLSSRHVLTAAQNLYHHYSEKEPDSAVFIPALQPHVAIPAKSWFYPYQYKDEKVLLPENYGLIELDEDVKEYTGYMEMKAPNPGEIENVECSIYGYPRSINGEFNYHLYGMSNEVALHTEMNLLTYDIYTSEGQAGSSIYYQSPEDNQFYIIGLHLREFSDHYNEGLLLTGERIDQILKWMSLADEVSPHRNTSNLHSNLPRNS